MTLMMTLKTITPAASAAKEIVLQDISFNLNAGRVIGLLGRTGSGQDHPHPPALPPV